MKSIEDFKVFVRSKPSLVKHVNDGGMTWQKFYDMWYLYGENNDVWNRYNVKEETKASASSLSELAKMFKNVDMDSVRNGISGIQKAIGIFLDMTNRGGSSGSGESTREPYTPRGMFRRFED